ncbi:MAG: hypothetical protein H6660_06805 [Ardenticatenaceae bacterium]|nr:hypothetical protein [Ardenticatenaceae bacterium]
MKPNRKSKFSRLFLLGFFWVLLLATLFWQLSRSTPTTRLSALYLHAGGDEDQYLPVIRFDPSPTPTVIPTLTPSNVEALVRIDPPFSGINGSTYDTGAFLIRNQSQNGIEITSVQIDLRTAILPDMVYDPFGLAGDSIFKDITVDDREGVVYSGRSYASDLGGGYQVLDLSFETFVPGGIFSFSVDVDPNSIRGAGAPGPNESGSVSGLELVGATIVVAFDNGVTLTQQLSRLPDSVKGSEALVRQGVPGQPQLAIAGIAELPTTVTEANQMAQVAGGEPGQTVRVLVVDAGLYTDGVPGGGFELDPYEANSAIGVREYTGVVAGDGTAVVPIVLSHNLPDAGYNYVVAVFVNHYGYYGRVSAPAVLYLQN